jgi:hypothetical protein
MKDFMMIFLGADYEEMGLSPEEMQARMGKWFAWNGKMTEQGIVKHGDALHASGRHITGKDMLVSDGPFVEGKELIGGYYVIQAKDMDAAIEVAKDFPDFDLGGTVEIREVMVFE